MLLYCQKGAPYTHESLRYPHVSPNWNNCTQCRIGPFNESFVGPNFRGTHPRNLLPGESMGSGQVAGRNWSDKRDVVRQRQQAWLRQVRNVFLASFTMHRKLGNCLYTRCFCCNSWVIRLCLFSNPARFQENSKNIFSFHTTMKKYLHNKKHSMWIMQGPLSFPEICMCAEEHQTWITWTKDVLLFAETRSMSDSSWLCRILFVQLILLQMGQCLWGWGLELRWSASLLHEVRITRERDLAEIRYSSST